MISDSRSSRVSRLSAVLAVALALCQPARGEGLRSARWKSTVVAEGARPGQALQEAQIWVEGGRMRIEDRTRGAPRSSVLETEDAVYVWEEGKTAGLKLTAALARRSGRPRHDYIRRIGEIRSRGKPAGSEKLDGHPCDVFDYESPQDGKGRYWLARDLQDFPVKVILEGPAALPPYARRLLPPVRLEYRNTDVRIPAKVAQAMLEPPAGVEFQDTSEVFNNRGRPIRR